jgi:hypothetical protein
MKRSLFLMGPLSLLLVAGCSSVYVHDLIGEEVALEERKQLEGTWLGAEDHQEPVYVRLSKSGELNLGALEWDGEKQEFAAATIPFVVTKTNDLRLLHIKLESESPEKGYLFARYEIDGGDTIRLYGPDAAVFEQAVAAGQLQGHVDRTKNGANIRLDGPSASIADFIHAKGPQKCFQEKPGTLKRLTRFE